MNVENSIEQLKKLKEKLFPERQIFLRSEGNVSFITLKSNVQIAISALLIVGTAWLISTSFTFLTRDLLLESKESQIANLNAENSALNDDFEALAVDVQKAADQLEARQKYLEEVISSGKVAEPVKVIDATQDGETSDAPKIISQRSEPYLLERLMGTATANADSSIPRYQTLARMTATLKKLDAQQQTIAMRLVKASESEISKIDQILIDTPLSSDVFIALAEQQHLGQGGPLIPLNKFEPVFNELDAKPFENLATNVYRLDVATSALQSVPTGEPAESYYISSRFGTRTDPFTKRKAKHPGLDMAGWPGTAIWATNVGTVIKAGKYPAYGNMVEIDHGNGIRTRYGHMKKLHVKRGETVTLGQKIGDMGKSGRATSSHLHYEIWFESEVRDPLPFLKAADNVRKIQRRNEKG